MFQNRNIMLLSKCFVLVIEIFSFKKAVNKSIYTRAIMQSVTTRIFISNQRERHLSIFRVFLRLYIIIVVI